MVLDNLSYMHPYNVPMTGGGTFNLHTIAWPTAFFEKGMPQMPKKSNPRKYFLEILKDLPIPKGAELIYENTKKYFTYIETQIANKSAEGDDLNSAP